jgi:hypothetical protein
MEWVKMSERELKFDLLKPGKPLRWIFNFLLLRSKHKKVCQDQPRILLKEKQGICHLILCFSRLSHSFPHTTYIMKPFLGNFRDLLEDLRANLSC